MDKKRKAPIISIRLTEKAIDILNKVTEEMGITRTSAIEIAIRKAYYYKDAENSVIQSIQDKICDK